jgi:hypothetical protein
LSLCILAPYPKMPLLLPLPFLRPVALFHLHSTGQPLIPESARVRQSLSIKTLLLCKPVLPLPQLLRNPLELGTSISGGFESKPQLSPRSRQEWTLFWA